jgi:FkbM family methyltransferase
VKQNRFFKDLIISAFSKAGFLLGKKTALNSEEKLIAYLLRKHNIDLVLDVGANKGQFAQELLKSGFPGEIISFEPLPAIYEELNVNTKKHRKWKAENLALGDEQGTITINVSENTESSSVLPMLSTHYELAPEAKYVNTISVPITTLDEYISSKSSASENIYLKIDVQGYEDSVINGGLNALKKVKVLQLEISFTPLYEKSLLYYTMMEKLEKMGFSIYSLMPAFTDYKTGQIFQVDAVYVRK